MIWGSVTGRDATRVEEVLQFWSRQGTSPVRMYCICIWTSLHLHTLTFQILVDVLPSQLWKLCFGDPHVSDWWLQPLFEGSYSHGRTKYRFPGPLIQMFYVTWAGVPGVARQRQLLLLTPPLEGRTHRFGWNNVTIDIYRHRHVVHLGCVSSPSFLLSVCQAA